MRKTRRKINRDHKKRKYILFTVFGLVILVLGIYGYLRFINNKSTSYISPVPEKYEIDARIAAEENLYQLEKKLHENNIEFEEIKKGNNSLMVMLKSKEIILIARDKDLDQQIASLQFILTRLTMEGRAFKSLDLRYDKPIIRE